MNRFMHFCFVLAVFWLPNMNGLYAQCNTLQGDQAVCVGDMETYDIDWPGIVIWSVQGGTSMSVDNNTAIVHWESSGAGIVTATLLDGAGTPVGTCDISVSVQSAPLPEIVSDITECNRFGDFVSITAFCEFGTGHFSVPDNPANTYSWTITGSTTSVVPDGNECTVTFGAAGSVTVCVTETTPNGCATEVCETYDVYALPTATFTEVSFGTDNPIHICKGQDLTFVGNFDDPNDLSVSLWDWNVVSVPGGTLLATGTQQVFHHIFLQAGTYEVILTASNCLGCFSEPYTVQVVVEDTEACPIICPSVVCEGVEEEYCADCDCPLYEWEVIGGTILSTNPDESCITVLWDNPPASGFGSVSLTTPGCLGVCTNPSVVDVPILPTLGEIATTSDFCNPNGNLQFSLQGWPGASYAWSFDIVNNQSGGTATGGINTAPNYNILLNNFVGTITVHVSVEHPIAGCMFEAELTVSIRNYTIQGPNVICWGDEPSYQLSPAPPAGSTVTWELFDNGLTTSYGVYSGNPVNIAPFPFPSEGAYEFIVTVVEPGGATAVCASQLLINVNPPVPPIENIEGPTEVCLGTPYVYTAIPEAPGTVHWSVSASGTLSSQTGQSVVVTWNAASPPPQLTAYRTLLYGTLECESEPFTLDNITVIVPPPSIDFTGNLSPCADQSDGYVYIANISGADTYEWEILPPGSGSILAGQGTPEVTIAWHLPTGPPSIIKLILHTSVCNAPLSVAHIINLQTDVAPVATITGTNPVCQGSSGNYSVDATGTSYEWTFDDGITPILVTTTVPTITSPVFNTPGTNFVRVKVTGVAPCDAEAEATMTVTVLENPEPVITTPDVPLCDNNGNPVPFYLTLYVANYNSANSTVEWFCTGNSTPIGTGPVLLNWLHDPTVPAPCTYTAVVTRIIDGISCTASDTYSVVYDCQQDVCTPGVDVDWTLDDDPATGCEKAIVSAIAIPFNPLDLDPLNSFWRIIDQAGGVTPNPEFITDPIMLNLWPKTSFTSPGFYPFYLQAVKINDPTKWCPGRSTIEIPLVTDFRWELACGEVEGTFDLKLTDISEKLPLVSNITTDWTLDGNPINSGSGQVVQTVTAGNAPYTVEVCLAITTETEYLKIGTDYGCRKCQTITIPAIPTAEFQYNQNQTCEGTAIQFTPTIAPGDVLGYAWDFGDGSGSVQPNPTKVYAVAGNYTVSLEVTTKYGCIRTHEQVVEVEENQLDGEITESMQPCDASAMLCFHQLAGDPTVSYIWSPDNETTMGILVTESGTYGVTATDGNGCTFSPDPINVLVTSPFPLGIIGDLSICASGNVNLSVLPVGGFTYSWVSSLGNQSGPNYSNFIQNPGSYQITVRAFRFGVLCQEISVTILVHPAPAVPLLQYQLLDCDPFTVEVTANQSVEWSLNGTHIGTGQSIIWNQGGNFIATAVSEFGCERINSVFVPTEIKLDAFLSGCYCLTAEELAAGNVPLYGVSGLGSGVTWQWIVNGNVFQSGTGNIPPLMLTNAMVGKIILRVTKQYANGVVCTEDSEPFCLEICEEGECSIPDPTVRAIHCIEHSQNQQKYYVHWDFMQDGETEPCNFTYGNGSTPVEVKDLTGAVVGYFEWIEDQSISGYWHMEGVMVITNGTPANQTCWDIPFCHIGTGIECDIATVCPGLSNPLPNELLNNCPGPVCNMQETLVQVTCDNNPFNPISHVLSVNINALVPPNGTFDLMVTSVTGTIFDQMTGLNYLWVSNVTSDPTGVLNTTINIPWYDEIGTDYACFQVLIKYDVENPNGPWGDVCAKRFCFDLNEFPQCDEDFSGGEDQYKFVYDCENTSLTTATYSYSIQFPTEATIASFTMEEQYGISSSEMLTGFNKLSGLVTTEFYKPIFKANVGVNRPNGSHKTYTVEELLKLCPTSGGGLGGRSDEENGLEKFGRAALGIQPNPASDKFTVFFNLDETSSLEGVSLSILNLFGEKMESVDLPVRTGSTTFNTSQLASGIYFVALKENGKTVGTAKLVISH